mmetsp:Transcript_82764/g.146151  ORF Transcript_82764/g.146151 Transcript_82764/m.146151 type:complete len:776 (-) Transcript_82764:38-2365(-)
MHEELSRPPTPPWRKRCVDSGAVSSPPTAPLDAARLHAETVAFAKRFGLQEVTSSSKPSAGTADHTSTVPASKRRAIEGSENTGVASPAGSPWVQPWPSAAPLAAPRPQVHAQEAWAVAASAGQSLPQVWPAVPARPWRPASTLNVQSIQSHCAQQWHGAQPLIQLAPWQGTPGEACGPQVHASSAGKFAPAAQAVSHAPAGQKPLGQANADAMPAGYAAPTSVWGVHLPHAVLSAPQSDFKPLPSGQTVSNSAERQVITDKLQDNQPLRLLPTAARNDSQGSQTSEPLRDESVEGRALAVLDRSYCWVPAAARPRPSSFAEDFIVADYEPGYLAMANPNARDARLDFEAGSHTYFVDGRAVSGSVTYLASSSSRPFDGEAAICSMRNARSQAWPRLKYVMGAQELPWPRADLALGGLLLVEGEKTRAALLPDEVAALGEASLEELLSRAQNTFGRLPPSSSEGADGFQLWAFEREMGTSEILKLWSSNGEEAANRGTEAHYQIELWLNCDMCRKEELEVEHALRFMGTTLADLGAKAYRTEWRIFGEAEDLAGSIDFAARLPGGALMLIDWKRSDKLRKGTRGFCGDRMAAPLDHLQDCKCGVYALQLNLYRWLLEAYYGERIDLMMLVSVHPEAPFITAVPDLSLEVSYLIHERRRQHSAVLRAEAAAPSALRCAHSSQLMTDAVKLEGKHFQKTCARRLLSLRNASPEEIQEGNDELRQAVGRLLETQSCSEQGKKDAEAAEAALENLLAGRQPWEELMPEEGLALSDAHLL